jgi:hypothetical protein
VLGPLYQRQKRHQEDGRHREGRECHQTIRQKPHASPVECVWSFYHFF